MINLSNYLDDVRITHGNWNVVEIGTPGGIRIGRTGRASFYYILQGTALITFGHGEVISLKPRDVALLLGDQPHILTDSPGSPVQKLRLLEEPNATADAVPVIRLGCRNRPTRILVGQCSIAVAHTHPLIKSVARITLIRGGSPIYENSILGKFTSDIEDILFQPGAVTLLNRFAELLAVDAVRRSVLAELHGGEYDLTGFDQPQIKLALQLFRSRFNEDWSVASMAEAVGMSRTSFANKFTRVVGKTPIHYVSELRMAKAMKLLSVLELKLSDIAKQVGYDSDVSFTRAFKKIHGISPSVYRKSNRK